MVRRYAVAVSLLLLSACGEIKNPFVAEAPFAPTPVPADFALIVEENRLTYINRSHTQQVITAADGKSRTTYTNYRDFGNTVAERFTQEKAVSPEQLQAMWDAVASRKLMGKEPLWVNWLSDTDLHLQNSFVLQIQANGKSRTYQEVNGMPNTVRPLMLLITDSRPAAPRSETSAPAASAPASAPATQP